MNICIFGASITHGEYDPVNSGWSGLLRKHLDDSDYDTTVYNLGISGNTTQDLLTRMENEATARKPKIIIISIGNNDSALSKKLGGPWIPEGQFTTNIQKVILLAKKFTPNIILTGLTMMDNTKTSPYPEDPDKTYLDERGVTYSQIICSYCKSEEVTYIPLHDTVSKSDLYDGLHPNTQGHEKIFYAVLPVIETMLKALSR